MRVSRSHGVVTVVDQDLLDILVCPETKQRLHMADTQLLERLNASVHDGSLRTRSGEVVSIPLEAGLVREDGQVIYSVRDDIPIMLIDEAIQLPEET